MPITGGNKVKNAFYKYVADVQENAIQAAISVLDYVGLECVKEARTMRKYTDQTGNLRSSTGYAVVYNGRIVKQSNFEKVKQTATEGAATGKKLIRQLASSYADGLVLILVAGMKYAIYVEARGYNVLNSAEDLARRLVPEMLREAGLRK